MKTEFDDTENEALSIARVTASCGNDNEVVVFTYKQLRDIAQMNETIGLYLKIAYPEVFK